MNRELHISWPVDHSFPPEPQPINVDGFTLTRRDRFWVVRDPAGELVCITVYKCGGLEVIRRLREKRAAAPRQAKSE